MDFPGPLHAALRPLRESMRLIGERDVTACASKALELALSVLEADCPAAVFLSRPPDRFEPVARSDLSAAQAAAVAQLLRTYNDHLRTGRPRHLFLDSPPGGPAGRVAVFPLHEADAFHGAMIIADSSAISDTAEATIIIELLAAQLAGALKYAKMCETEVLSHDALELTTKLATDRAAYWETLVRNLQEPIILLHPQGGLASTNPHGRALLLSFDARGEAAGLALLLAALDSGDLVAEIAQGRRYTDKPLTVTDRLYTVNVHPVGGDAETGIVIIAHDVTDLRKLERQKDEFLATASHELRTPLAVVQGYMDLITRMAPDAEGLQRPLHAMRSNVSRLTRLAKELLDVVRIEGGKLPLDRRAFDLHALLDEVRDTFADLKPSATVELASPAVGEVNADRGALQQVLENLVGNAIKYGPPDGCVRIDTVRGAASLRIEVSDQGRPIPAEECERIFGRFEQAKSSYAQGGLGLGLYLSREIVERHGGRLWVEPQTTGNRFVLELPCTDQEAFLTNR